MLHCVGGAIASGAAGGFKCLNLWNLNTEAPDFPQRTEGMLTVARERIGRRHFRRRPPDGIRHSHNGARITAYIAIASIVTAYIGH